MAFNYLKTYGSKRHAYNIHLERMRQAGENPVSYVAFCDRLKKGWDFNKSIYTPSNTKKIPNRFNMRPKKSRWQILIDYFKRG